MDKKSVGIVVDGSEFLFPVQPFKGIKWELVNEEFENQFYNQWDGACSYSPLDAEKCWMLDTLGWMINEERFTKETSFEEAWKLMIPVYTEEQN